MCALSQCQDAAGRLHYSAMHCQFSLAAGNTPTARARVVYVLAERPTIIIRNYTRSKPQGKRRRFDTAQERQEATRVHGANAAQPAPAATFDPDESLAEAKEAAGVVAEEEPVAAAPKKGPTPAQLTAIKVTRDSCKSGRVGELASLLNLTDSR